ncbi:MAG: Gx transporter family protein [Clostridiales bacterium]|nr:Gx transporter family protein [Clostridiales bacterium]
MKRNTKLLAVLGVSTAAAMILSYLETLIPMNFAVPGVKIGLANLVTLFLLIKIDWKSAAAVTAVRVLLSSLLFGSFTSLAYSLAGAVLSLAVMGLLKKTERFTALGISIAGAVSHNAGQVIMAVILLSTKEIAYWLPVLIVTGTVTGLAVGAVGALLVKKIDLKL